MRGPRRTCPRLGGGGTVLGFRADAARGHAYADAPLVDDRVRYPVLVFSPAGFLDHARGDARGGRQPRLHCGGHQPHLRVGHLGPSRRARRADGRRRMGPMLGAVQRLAEDAFRGRAAVADTKVADIRFVVDQLDALEAGTDHLAGRLDLGRLGAFGHSLGATRRWSSAASTTAARRRPTWTVASGTPWAGWAWSDRCCSFWLITRSSSCPASRSCIWGCIRPWRGARRSES